MLTIEIAIIKEKYPVTRFNIWRDYLREEEEEEEE